MTAFDRWTHTALSVGLVLVGLYVALLTSGDSAPFGWLLVGAGVLGVLVRLFLPPLVRGGRR